MSIEIEVYLRNPSEIGSGKMLGRCFVESLPALGYPFDATVLGEVAPNFPVQVGGISHGLPRTKVSLIPG